MRKTVLTLIATLGTACAGPKLPPVVSTDNVDVVAVDNQSIAKTKTATTISVANPTNKPVKQINFHTRPKKEEEKLKAFELKVFGQEADTYVLKIKNLSTNQEKEQSFPKDKEVIVGKLVIGDTYEVTSTALLNNEVIANAITTILISNSMNTDIYFDFIQVENQTYVPTIDGTVKTGGVIDKRQLVKPEPTLSIAPNAVMRASIDPTVGYPSGTPFKLLFAGLKPNSEYKVSYGNNPEFTNESSNHQFSDATGKILLEYSSSSYNVGHYYYKVSDLSTGESSITSMEIIAKP